MAVIAGARSPSSAAYAPIGIWQPPPSRVTTARSAASAAAASASSIVATARAHARVAVAHFDGDDALTRRRHARVGRQQRRDALARAPAAASPAAASTSASIVAARRASAAACRGCRESGRNVRAGKQPRELRDPPDAARADARRAPEHARRSSSSVSDRRVRRRQHDRVARVLARQHGAELAGRRAAPPACPCCCARRGRSSPASSASSISLTNSRLPPISESGASASRSPDVLMTTISQATPARSRSSAATALRLKQRELAAARAEPAAWSSTSVLRRSADVGVGRRVRRLDRGRSSSRSRNSRLTASV